MASEITLDALTKRKAEAQSPQVETAPTPAQTDAVRRAVEALTPEERAKAEEIKNGIDLMDSQTAILYGVGAQRNLAEFSDNILANVRNKDTGYVGDLMSELVEKVRDVGVDEAEGGFLDKLPFLRSAARAVRRLLARYEKIEVQIDRIQRDLEEARMQMLKDIAMFDGLYEKNLEYFRGLQVYIVAGEEKLRETREETLPRLRAEAQAKGDPMSAQVVRDFEDTVDRFEKKLHDLKLSKAIAIQTAPQIRLIQNNDKLLVDKIQTAILSTIPLWKGQIVIALGLARQQSALQMQRSVTDTTNELLQKNAELLKQNSLDVARESERGIVDLETLKKVNDDLISTIEETIQIQREGRAARQSAEAELADEIADIDHVTSVLSYAGTVGKVPSGFLSDDIVSQFYSDNYARIIVYTDTGEEGDEAFAVVTAVREAASALYDESWTCGQSANLLDMRDVVTHDSVTVNLIAIAFIFLTLLVTFRSITLPFILLFVIESAIWINLSVPYFTDTPLVYLGYLVINTVQLGATIDYAILMTEGYVVNRRTMGRREAVESTLTKNFISVLTSGLILSAAGFCLGFESSLEVVAELGILLCRGTLLSMAMVLLALPALLMIFDPLTARLTLKSGFLKKTDKEVETK